MHKFLGQPEIFHSQVHSDFRGDVQVCECGKGFDGRQSIGEVGHEFGLSVDEAGLRVACQLTDREVAAPLEALFGWSAQVWPLIQVNQVVLVSP